MDDDGIWNGIQWKKLNVCVFCSMRIFCQWEWIKLVLECVVGYLDGIFGLV